MALGRRKIRLEDEAAWVFNRMAEAYPARPAYPEALVAALVALLPTGGRRVLDVGAGIGHLAIPLAARGLEVVAVEPAQAMLEVLRRTAHERGLAVETLHATAEALPVEASSFDLVLVADVLHFLDAELAGREVARALVSGGGLSLLTCGLGDTRFMRSVVQLMEESAPRRPRAIASAAVQFFKMAQADPGPEHSFADETPVDAETLERILRSISYIGPAMNEARFSEFSRRLRLLPEAPAWARAFQLKTARRR